MLITPILILFILIWLFFEFLLGCYVCWKRSQIRHIYRIEKTRRYFAEARNNLMKLALNQKINVDSKTFLTIYRINTYIMRRPDQYPEISKMLLHAICDKTNSKSGNSLEVEARDWDQEIKKVVQDTAYALGLIVIDYSRLLRILTWFEKRFGVISHITKYTKKLKQREEKHNQVISRINQAQRSLNSLCTA